MKQRRGIIGVIAMASIPIACIITVPPDSGAAVATQTPAQIAVTTAQQAQVSAGLNATAYQCVSSANQKATANVPPGTNPATVTKAFAKADAALTGPGAPCSNGGIFGGVPLTPGAKEGVVSSTTASSMVTAGACAGGPYNTRWNINGHTASDWLTNSWDGYACWAGEVGKPLCFGGDTAPLYSVTQNFCYVIKSPQAFEITVRDLFTINFGSKYFDEHWAFWYWQNELTDGVVQDGCTIC